MIEWEGMAIEMVKRKENRFSQVRINYQTNTRL